jgi:hypothetical protein
MHPESRVERRHLVPSHMPVRRPPDEHMNIVVNAF